jgi:hypothetical protein
LDIVDKHWVLAPLRTVLAMVLFLHDDAPAGLVTATAVARLSARENRLGLDNGGDGGSDTARHFEGLVPG